MPIDLVLGSDNETSDPEDWVSSHQDRLRQAFRAAAQYTEKEALQRRERHNRTANASQLPVGCRVFVRNLRIRGRNKIQDEWEDKVYQVVDHPDPGGNVYVVLPLQEEGPIRTLHRSALLDARELVGDLHLPTSSNTAETEMGEERAVEEDLEEATEVEVRWVQGTDHESSMLAIEDPVDRGSEEVAGIMPNPDVSSRNTEGVSGVQRTIEQGSERRMEPVNPSVELPTEEGQTGSEQFVHKGPGKVADTGYEKTVGESGVDQRAALDGLERTCLETRRSARSNKGTHSNPHNLPRSAVHSTVQEVDMHRGIELLETIAETQRMILKLVDKVSPGALD